MTATTELRASLEAGLATLIADRAEIDSQIAAVQKALEALSNGKPEPAKPRAARRPTQRKLEVVPAGKLLKMLSEADGVSAPELAKNANADPAQVNALLRELEAGGRVRRTGERRGMRWHRYTDEDRVQERAAELAAQSKSTPITAGLFERSSSDAG